MKEVEISQIETQYENKRIKDKSRERSILSSILEGGIREPLKCVIKPDGRLTLLDGFKRLRCSIKLGMKTVPVESLGSDESMAILKLLRLSNSKMLSILEQAVLVDELNKRHKMSVTEISRHLERSVAWVSVRIGAIKGMSDAVREAIFGGQFPVRSYMYTLRHFTRVNKIKGTDIDTFVKTISGKGLSTRNIELLAQGYFNGSENLKEQIQQGNLDWTLNQLKLDTKSNNTSFNEQESKTLRDLEFTQRCIGVIPYKLRDSRLKNPLFFTEAQILIEGILSKADNFIKVLKEFYDKQR